MAELDNLTIKVELTEELKNTINNIVQRYENTAWLVEGVNPRNNGADWLCCINGCLIFSQDPNAALRFKRKEDAEAMSKFYVDCFASEHTWMDI